MALDHFHAVVTDSLSVNAIFDKLKPRKIVYDDNGEFISFDPVKLSGITVKSIIDNVNARCCIDLEGSLHKYFNVKRYGKVQNFDDFTFSLQKRALNMLAIDLNCDLGNILIKSFEFGVNINCGLQPNKLIHKMYYYDKRKIPTENEYSNSGYQIKFVCDSYLLKIYNKSQESKLFNLQWLKMPKDILRIEIKYRDKNACTTIAKVNNLSDFKETNKVAFIYGDLQNHWDKVLMYNSQIPIDSMTKREKEWYSKCSVAKYFLDPSKEHFRGINQTKVNHYEQFKKILDKYNYRSEYFDLTKLIEYKCDFLMNQENDLIERVMDTIYEKLLNAPKATRTLLKETIETLISNGSDEIINKLINQAIERLQRAGHIEIMQSNPISYRSI